MYHQRGATGLGGGNWSAAWQVTKSTKVQHLLRRLLDIKAVKPHAAHGAAAFGGGQPNGQTANGQMLTGQGWLSSQGAAVECDVGRSGVNLSAQPARGILKAAAGTWQRQQHELPLTKAIVFSQFWTHVRLIAQELTAYKVRTKRSLYPHVCALIYHMYLLCMCSPCSSILVFVLT